VYPTAPKNLNLLTIRFPLPAIVSILHRISGLALFFLIPCLLWILELSLTAEGFQTLQDWFRTPLVKWLLWLFLLPFCYHFVAGIRHLLSDIRFGNTQRGGKVGAGFVFVMVAVLMIGLGVMLW
jgi:succinate dehydrogenase / fumarate reductase cytochrome b subunit